VPFGYRARVLCRVVKLKVVALADYVELIQKKTGYAKERSVYSILYAYPVE
jgi:hypothetical protein